MCDKSGRNVTLAIFRVMHVRPADNRLTHRGAFATFAWHLHRVSRDQSMDNATFHRLADQLPRLLGHFFPTFWAMTAFHGVVTFGRGLEAIVLPFFVLVGFGALFTWLGTRTLKVNA